MAITVMSDEARKALNEYATQLIRQDLAAGRLFTNDEDARRWLGMSNRQLQSADNLGCTGCGYTSPLAPGAWVALASHIVLTHPVEVTL